MLDRTVLFVAACLLVWPAAALPVPEEPPVSPRVHWGEEPAPPVEELVAEALARSPALAAARSRLAAARELERSAEALPDPIVEAMLQNADFPRYTIGREDMSMAGVEVRQPLPHPGKRRARGEVAGAKTAMRAAEATQMERRIAAEVRSLYARIYLVDSELRSLSPARELVELMSATATALRVRRGGASKIGWHPLWPRRERAMDGAEVGDLGHAPVLLRRCLPDGREDGRHGVVDPDIDRPQLLLDPGRGALHRVGLCHVERQHEGAADPGGGAGDDHDLGRSVPGPHAGLLLSRRAICSTSAR